MDPTLSIVAGLLLLILGRKLFWLFVAITGFVTGFYLIPHLVPGVPEGLHLAVGLVGAVAGAVLAIFLQRVAVGVAGFLAGGYAAGTFFGGLSLRQETFPWGVFLVGGIAGAILLSLAFDWVLVVLSSLLGSTLTVQGLRLSGETGVAALLALFVLGVIVQARLMKERPLRS